MSIEFNLAPDGFFSSQSGTAQSLTFQLLLSRVIKWILHAKSVERSAKMAIVRRKHVKLIENQNIYKIM